MTTLLLANNTLLLGRLSRQLNRLRTRPVVLQTPDWLLTAAPDQLPKQPVSFVLLDCSGAQANRRLLLETLYARLAPRRCLLMDESCDAELTGQAARLGASGCLPVPASPDVVSAAIALVSAGGQCFPRLRSLRLRTPALSSSSSLSN
ncbi:DNA-binding response regulator [Cupriavidus respiraculi]|uniref:DNA-binding response regulator n=1 Tax=Cupriavidus respiraculi TaxID=195930 RepID=UPI001C966195|nr:DNA-binding response regulator [Cupriavidus respiraculi]MBY4949691.1 DNA-binding response regulator [Cupriavidus respiraculi]